MISCSICYENTTLIKTKCNHSFCRKCIHCWSKKKKRIIISPLYRKILFWNVEDEFLNFLKENNHSNISILKIIEEFIFYYRGFYNDTFSSIQYILNILDYKDREEYNYQNIIDAIEYNYHHRYIFSREIVRYHNKSFFKKMKNYGNTFLNFKTRKDENTF